MNFTAKLPLVALVSLAGVLIRAQGQAPPQTNQPAPVFRSETRLVLLDVVVTDPSGHPIGSLKPQDFTVLEDGKPQAILSFDAQAPEIVRPKPAAPVVLPDHEYTNYSPGSGDSSCAVVLVDAVNSNREDLVNVREQLLQFVKKMPAGKQVAIYALAGGLTMLQSFTSDPKLLAAAAERLTARPGSSYTDNRQLFSRCGRGTRSSAAQNPAFLHGIIQNLGEQQESKSSARPGYFRGTRAIGAHARGGARTEKPVLAFGRVSDDH